VSATQCDILVIGTSIDSHVNAVRELLPTEMQVAHLAVDRFPKESSLSVHYKEGSYPVLEFDDGGTRWDISAPRVAWFRRLGAPGLADSLDEKYRAFALGEAEQLIDGVCRLARPNSWVNEYSKTREADNKLVQLHLARQCGLLTPETLITNDLESARTWISAEDGPVLAKSIHSPLIAGHGDANREWAFSHVLTALEGLQLLGLEHAPAQLQQFVPKAYELRVTTVGDRHFVARIDTSRGSSDEDWRRGEHEVSATTALPHHVGSALNRLLFQLGLRFAASDFIVTPNGDYIFLEANPHGAWLWIERQVPQYDVSAAIAALLSAEIDRR